MTSPQNPSAPFVPPHSEQAAVHLPHHDLIRLNEAGQNLTSTLEKPEVLQRLLQMATELIGAEGSSVWLWDEENPDYLLCEAAYHQTDHPALANVRLKAGQGIAGWVAQHGQSAAVSHTRQDPRFYAAIDDQTNFTTRSLLAVPLRLREQTIGILEVVNKLEDSFTDKDITLAETLAISAAIAIDNANLVARLQQQKEDLELQNAELDAFAHTVAHDLQNPLSLVLGYSEVLQYNDDQTLTDGQQAMLDTVVRNARRMGNIVQELLVLASVRQQEVITRPLDMAKSVAAALERLALLVEQQQATIILPESWQTAVGYAPWIEEVWENYLSNALKYGGTPPHLELGSEPLANGYVCFWVRDNGPGLTEQQQAQLFVPFTKLSQIRVTGHGLGLSIVQRIIQKLQGQVSVCSTVGEGSVFSFTLPTAVDSVEGGE
ncbi:MAG: GAF domain-containing sensor histidine kinase [Anaerolineales bacterium]|nr:GAF domain-containing sensor histidine kinase [Anaerolineales bacterium]